MRSHCSFRHLKHKLWPKEGSGVKLSVWLPTRKSQELTQFTCVQKVCDILLESSRRGATTLLQTASRSKVCLQSYEVPKPREFQLGRFRDSHLGVPGQKAIWMWVPWKGAEYIIKGKVVASPKWSLMCSCCPWLVLAPKMLQLTTLCGFCASLCEWMKLVNSS
jgi:hypothetical protein